MKFFNTIFFLALIAILLSGCKKGIPLFEEGKPDSWIQKGDAKWEFFNGEIKGTLLRGTGFLMTKEAYGDFELQLEFYPDETINSGVFVRCSVNKLSFSECYEINIWDFHPEPNDRTGAIVSITKPLVHLNTIDKWNTYKIKCAGNRIKAWLNEELIADVEDDDLEEGYIGLQAAGIGTIKFKNIVIKTD